MTIMTILGVVCFCIILTIYLFSIKRRMRSRVSDFVLAVDAFLAGAFLVDFVRRMSYDSTLDKIVDKSVTGLMAVVFITWTVIELNGRRHVTKGDHS